MRYMGSVSLVYGEVDESNKVYGKCGLVYGKVDMSNEVCEEIYVDNGLVKIMM